MFPCNSKVRQSMAGYDTIVDQIGLPLQRFHRNHKYVIESVHQGPPQQSTRIPCPTSLTSLNEVQSVSSLAPNPCRPYPSYPQLAVLLSVLCLKAQMTFNQFVFPFVSHWFFVIQTASRYSL